MPNGKPAGERCLHLSVEMLCALFGLADPEVCGTSQEEAIRLIGWWEQATTAA
jgi:hypothetical protein